MDVLKLLKYLHFSNWCSLSTYCVTEQHTVFPYFPVHPPFPLEIPVLETITPVEFEISLCTTMKCAQQFLRDSIIHY
jgi:hypothetical protein